jgi:hypothetical protein
MSSFLWITGGLLVYCRDFQELYWGLTRAEPLKYYLSVLKIFWYFEKVKYNYF